MKVHNIGQTAPKGVTLPLSAAVEAEGLLFFSGQLAPKDGETFGDIEAQTNRIFDLLEAKLAALGLSLDHMVKATVWLTEAADFAGFNAVYRQRVAEPYPARSCVVSALVIPGARIEIEIVASRTRRAA